MFPCPYCDGWENADRDLAALGTGKDAAELAAELRLWSESVACFFIGEAPGSHVIERMRKLGVGFHRSVVVKAVGENGRLSGLELADGTVVPCQALFLVGLQIQHDDFLEKMGCHLSGDGQVECDDSGRTNTPGLFVAGNAKKGLQMAMVAAADGIKRGAAANEWLLQREERGD